MALWIYDVKYDDLYYDSIMSRLSHAQYPSRTFYHLSSGPWTYPVIPEVSVESAMPVEGVFLDVSS